MDTGITNNKAGRSPRRERQQWWAWLRLILMGLVLAGVTAAVIVLPLVPTERVALGVGDVTLTDIRAPRRFTYESDILRAEEQERAALRVEPVYTQPDSAPARQQLDRARKVLDYLGSVIADPLASSVQKRAWVLAVPELANLPPEVVNDLLDLPEDSWNRVQTETLAVLDQAMRREIQEGAQGAVAEIIPTLVSLDLSDQETSVTVALVRPFLVPNAFLDVDATAQAQARAREEVPPVLRSFEANEIIVREGERVTTLDVEVLDELGLRRTQTEWIDYVGGILLALVATALLLLYLARFQPETVWRGQKLLLLVLLVSFFVLIAGLMVPSGFVLRYLSPTPALAILAAGTLGPQAGVGVAIFAGLVSGAIADYSLEMAIYAGLGSVVAALTLGRIERIRALFRAGGYAALVHVVIVAAFSIPLDMAQPNDPLVSTLAGVANGGLSASLALGGLFLVGPLFDVITTMRLIELSRPNHPLLQRLLREAPGTYHHSLMVANMAEQAAERIGANALLTRVGAYYHDIGKIAQPYFFIENQVDGANPHGRLDPHASAAVIIDHVRDGVTIGRRYRLPYRVRAFIPEHHGTSWVSFFYKRAVEQAGDETLVDEAEFHYPGMVPQSRETALVMLADACEAAVRAKRPTSAEEIADIVNKVIDQRVDEGQLSECDLTLRELSLTREALISSLRGVFHPRIDYPKAIDIDEE
jgi:putative nucleotidyltransferase with HDIG domain